MENLDNYKKRFRKLLETKSGDVKPLIGEQWGTFLSSLSRTGSKFVESPYAEPFKHFEIDHEGESIFSDVKDTKCFSYNVSKLFLNCRVTSLSEADKKKYTEIAKKIHDQLEGISDWGRTMNLIKDNVKSYDDLCKISKCWDDLEDNENKNLFAWLDEEFNLMEPLHIYFKESGILEVSKVGDSCIYPNFISHDQLPEKFY